MINTKDTSNKLSKARINQLNSLICGLNKEATKKGITEEKLEEMMEEAKIQSYKKTYGNLLR